MNAVQINPAGEGCASLATLVDAIGAFGLEQRVKETLLGKIDQIRRDRNLTTATPLRSLFNAPDGRSNPLRQYFGDGDLLEVRVWPDRRFNTAEFIRVVAENLIFAYECGPDFATTLGKVLDRHAKSFPGEDIRSWAEKVQPETIEDWRRDKCLPAVRSLPAVRQLEVGLLCPGAFTRKLRYLLYFEPRQRPFQRPAPKRVKFPPFPGDFHSDIKHLTYFKTCDVSELPPHIKRNPDGRWNRQGSADMCLNQMEVFAGGCQLSRADGQDPPHGLGMKASDVRLCVFLFPDLIEEADLCRRQRAGRSGVEPLSEWIFYFGRQLVDPEYGYLTQYGERFWDLRFVVQRIEGMGEGMPLAAKQAAWRRACARAFDDYNELCHSYSRRALWTGLGFAKSLRPFLDENSNLNLLDFVEARLSGAWQCLPSKKHHPYAYALWVRNLTILEALLDKGLRARTLHELLREDVGRAEVGWTYVMGPEINKTGKEVRNEPVGEYFSQGLTLYVDDGRATLAHRHPEFCAASDPPFKSRDFDPFARQSPWLFLSSSGRQLGYSSIGDLVCKTTERVLGIPISPHAFRHLLAIGLDQRNWPHEEIAALLIITMQTLHRNYLRPHPKRLDAQLTSISESENRRLAANLPPPRRIMASLPTMAA